MNKILRKKIAVSLIGISLSSIVVPITNSFTVHADESKLINKVNINNNSENLFHLSQYVDKYVFKNENRLELSNEKKILEYISKNLEKYIDNDKLKTKEDVLNYLKGLINNFNNQATNPYKKINDNKELVDRYTLYLAFDHSDYSKSVQWFGIQHIFYTDRTAINFGRDLDGSGDCWAALGIASFKVAPLAAGFGGLGLYLKNVASNLTNFVNDDPDQGCVLNISWVGYYQIFKR